tara:strand:- start:610 stop:816 length:207 start_codon:yes stop_codon:yes gene_type:complete
MLDRFKNLDKKQKLKLYRVFGWSGTSMLGGIQGVRVIEGDFTNFIIGWVVGLVIVFIVFRTLRILNVI